MKLFTHTKNTKNDKTVKETYQHYPYLLKIKPHDKYIFHSDYFQIDNQYATILTFVHDDGANDNFGYFWGINRVPSGLDADITTINFEQVHRLPESWISTHQHTTEQVMRMDKDAQNQMGTLSSKQKHSRGEHDILTITSELNDGGAYLHVTNRIMIKAPTLKKLDNAVDKLTRLYLDRFATLHVAAYSGAQREEFTNLFAYNNKKRGRGFYYTSQEYAGSYSLVTHGMEDPDGEYVGYMIGDVNNSAVLFNSDNYAHHVVVASEQYDKNNNRAWIADMWGSKIGQNSLMNNHRSVHIILDGAHLDTLGPDFHNITSTINVNSGDINMFEMFGQTQDELAIFPSHMTKLILMAEQAYETTPEDRSIIRGSLEDIATTFYIDNNMWYENAKENRDRLRVVGIPHDQVPKLETFVAYLDTAYKAMANSSVRDDEKLHALSVLQVTFKNLLSNNGDLFNTITSDSVDSAINGLRVIYDFSSLMLRGKGIAMAQLVNIIGLATQTLKAGDTIIFHGAENIDKGIRDYINTMLEHLWAKGGRVVYLYTSIDKMLADQDFNHFDKADYTILGTMSENQEKQYEKQLAVQIPADLHGLITSKSMNINYIRRAYDNVVFYQDLHLGNKQ